MELTEVVKIYSNGWDEINKQQTKDNSAKKNSYNMS